MVPARPPAVPAALAATTPPRGTPGLTYQTPQQAKAPSAAAVVRAAAPDEPAPVPRPRPVPRARLSMPSPENLGVRAPSGPQGAGDWGVLSRRLRDLGATDFHLDHSPAGYRFSVLLPGDRPGLTRRIDAAAATETEAVRLGLDQVEQYSQARR